MKRLPVLWAAAWASLLPGGAALATTVVKVNTATGNEYTFQLSSSNTLFEALNASTGGSERFDVAILGDGYTESTEDQTRLTRSAKTFVENLFLVPPYSDFKSCINVWLVNLVSKESGIDNPDHSPPDVDTALDCSFKTGSMEISGSIDRCEEVCFLADVPFDVIYVVVNDTYGHNGSWALYEQEIAFSSDKYLFGTIMAHELGHLIGRLADEYRYPDCTSSMATYTEDWPPEEPNVTNAATVDAVPWKDLLQTESFPTTIDSVCSAETIGRWEGGDRRCYGVYRPRQYCLMDGATCDDPTIDDFCSVCARAITDSLSIRYGCSP